MECAIKTVGVVGTGVIGASWTALFLANGLRVLVSDPAPGAKDRLATYLNTVWPVLERLHLCVGASLSNWTFVGENLGDACAEVDFIQEVSSGNLLRILTGYLVLTCTCSNELFLARTPQRKST